ncbi:peptidylprolyl isomerase [Gammaproteobacteria bacterium 45_16_T64]|nr:peptidylprolyl isomerase [Gammaproteobacteria bacterium 45_16_T64]
MDTVLVNLQTNFGPITLELNKEKAPASVENFLSYVNKGHYDGTIFHRVISNFMVQGGGFDTDMNQKDSDDPIKNEANNGLKNEIGSIAMARTNDPHSASSQFFINVQDNGFLNFTSESSQGWGYAVFGKVSEGMDIVNKIKEVKTGMSGGHQDVPTEPVIIEKAEVVNSAE